MSVKTMMRTKAKPNAGVLLSLGVFCLSACQSVFIEGSRNNREAASDPSILLPTKTLEATPKNEIGLNKSHLQEPQNCPNSIYANYLRQNYLMGLEKQRKNKRRLFGRDLRTKTNQAVYFASSLLRGLSSHPSGALPVLESAEVQFWLSYYTGRGRKTFLKWLLRSQELESLVSPILAEKGMPPEIFYLAMIESGLNTRARSKAGATGLWQFLASTAKMYGLKVNHWVDERRDPLKSTLAASSFLLDLYRRFGDWHLAMAAYNAGPGSIRRAIRKAKTRDYWELIKTKHLRLETKNYVPKVIAAIFLAKNYSHHGFSLSKKEIPPLVLGAVRIREPVRLNEIADRLGVSRNLLKAWNPELIRGITPPLAVSGAQGYSLKVAKKEVQRVKAIRPALTRIKVKQLHIHTVTRGETLSGIARKYRISLTRLRSFNKKILADRLRLQQKVTIPL